MLNDERAGLVPAPASFRSGTGTVAVADGTRVAADAELRPAARWWGRVTEAAFGVVQLPDGGSLPGGTGVPGARIVFAVDADLPAGGYRLAIGRETGDASRDVVVRAADLPGAFAAAQTLRQLAGPPAFRCAPVPPAAPGEGAPGEAAAPSQNDRDDHSSPHPDAAPAVVRLPAVIVTDGPRFPWRGVLLDVARHFLPKQDVLRFVDLAAMHKLNMLQLHFTDDQGWRFEVLRYPELTRTGAWRAESTVGTWRTGTGDGTPHGGFYTQDDLREIVAYARARGITVVPEIDVPGHVEAAVAAYPFLGTRKERHGVRTTWGISEDVLDPSEESLAFFRHVLDEVADVFDAPWIHLGGDEVPVGRWEASPAVRAHAEALGLLRARSGSADDGRREPDVRRLHGWFLARLADHVRSLGRRAVVWDEAFGPGLPRDVVVMAWQAPRPHVAAEALAAGHDVVVAPEHAYYLDHRASDQPDEPIPVGFVRTIEDVLAYDPLDPWRDRPGVTDGPVEVREALGPAAGGRPPVPGAATWPAPNGTGRLLGGQAQVWTEHLDSARRVDYAVFPRLAAIAETLWSPRADRSPGSPSSAEFLDRLAAHHLPRLDAYGVEYRPPDGPLPWQRRPGVPGHARDLAAEQPTGGSAGRSSAGRSGGGSAGRSAGGSAGGSAGRPSGRLAGGPADVVPSTGGRRPGPGSERSVGLVRGVRVPRPDGTLTGPADLRIEGGRIVSVEPAGRTPSCGDGGVLDGDGRVVLPGLIDAHSHAEGTVFDPDVQHSLLRQGVTTVVTGQDGVSYAPGNGAWPSAYFAAILGEHPSYRGPRVRDLLATYDGVVPVNVAYLAPHGTLRHEVLGGSPKRATQKEIARMARLLRQALDDGACGLSTGLEYLPGGYADERELAALAAVVAGRGLPHVSHMRGYEDKAGDGFAELLRIARISGAATHVSHYHGPAAELAGYVDGARGEGLDVTFDSYPYLRGCSILAMVALPGWLPLADPAATVTALGEDEVVARLRREHFPGLADLWPRITCASVPARPGRRNLTWAEGRTLPEVARLLGLDPAGAVLELLTASELRTTCVFAQPPVRSADGPAGSVRALANHPAHMGGSDAVYPGGRPHPRGWGAFARMLSEHVGLGDWSWHDAAEHLSGRAARRFGFAGRGALEPGSAADVVLVDPDRLRDRATYDLPRVVAAGIDDVLVAGVPVLAAGALTGAAPGVPLRPSR